MSMIISSKCFINKYLSNNIINYFIFLIKAILFLSIFPYFSSNSIKIKLYQEQNGNVCIFNWKEGRACPYILSENDIMHDDSDKCNPFLNKGEHNIYIEFDYLTEDCTAMFESRTALIELDLSNFDASNVKYMAYMFKGCTSLQKVIMPSIKGYKLEQMKNMFIYCSNLISVEFQQNFVTKNVINMQKMFKDCVKLKSINFPIDFDTSSVTAINDMFSGCSSLLSINLSFFKTNNIENMVSLFQNTKMISYDISNFDTSKVTDMEYMFDCNEITSLDLSNFDYSKLEKMDYMLSNNNNLQYINFGKKEIRENISSYKVFENSNKKMIIYVNKKNPEDLFKGTEFTLAFVECSNISTSDIIMESFSENKIVCVAKCKNLNKYKFKYLNRCYLNCPSDTITNLTS